MSLKDVMIAEKQEKYKRAENSKKLLLCERTKK